MKTHAPRDSMVASKTLKGLWWGQLLSVQVIAPLVTLLGLYHPRSSPVRQNGLRPRCREALPRFVILTCDREAAKADYQTIPWLV